MKRALFDNIKVQPYNSGTAIDRDGFLSAVLTVNALAAGTVKVAVTHSDTATGSFEALNDPRLFMDGAEEVTAAKGDNAVFNIDLLGCKQFVKFTVSGTGTSAESATSACALVLGDAAQAPVEG